MRKIVSFVRRQGRMTDLQKDAIDRLWNIHVLENDIFPVCNENKKLIFEIGFGMGDNLIDLAINNPENNYIGVDVHKPGIGSVLYKIEKFGLTNIKLYCCDVVELFENTVQDNSLDKILILFPDPWKKRKHIKRRLINDYFIKLVAKSLKANAILHVATDWEDYAKQIENVVDDSKLFSRIKNSYDNMRIETKFEARGKIAGREIFDFVWLYSTIIGM